MVSMTKQTGNLWEYINKKKCVMSVDAVEFSGCDMNIKNFVLTAP